MKATLLTECRNAGELFIFREGAKGWAQPTSNLPPERQAEYPYFFIVLDEKWGRQETLVKADEIKEGWYV